MRNFGFIVLALVLVPAASARAGGYYFTPKIGYGFMKADFSSNATTDDWSGNSYTNTLSVFGLAVGHDYNPLRTEWEFTWREETEKAKIGILSNFFNFYFDIHNSSSITPYLGAGMGIASVSVEYRYSENEQPYNVSGTKSNLAWNIGAGAAWNITDWLSLDLGYRYASYGKVEELKVTASEVLLGARFTP